MRAAMGDVLQGAAADCKSAGETHAWFDSRIAHHLQCAGRLRKPLTFTAALGKIRAFLTQPFEFPVLLPLVD